MPPNLSEESASEPTSIKQTERRDSSVSSVSLRSEGSIQMPPNLSEESASEPTSGSQTERRDSSFSYISLRSDGSIQMPPNLGEEHVPETTRKGKERIRRWDRLKTWPKLNPQRVTSPEINLTLNMEQYVPLPGAQCIGHTLHVLATPQQRVTASKKGCPALSRQPHLSTAESGNIKRAIKGHKASLRKRFEVVPRESTKLNCDVPFHAIYTELYLMAGVSQQINVEHEVQQIEMMHMGQTVLPNEPINCSDIFKPLQREQMFTRTVMTKGIAGIGKTMFVQKFILDWAEGQANQDLDLVFVLPFRELNLMVSKQSSLHSLLLELFEDLNILEDLQVYKECKLLFILDGLDESKLHLDFQGKKVCDTNKAVSVSELVTNLIRGDLLPTSLIWVTSRPAAASQIPAQYIDQVTELRGFSDTQKEEFIRRKIGNQTVANNIISHVRATRSLLIMCYIPVFCLLITTMFQQILYKIPKRSIPKNMTEVFTEFITTLLNTQPQLQEAKGEVICKLAKLAFTHLQKQQFTFYEDDLRECGINTSNSRVFSGLCIEILKESITCGQRAYSFLHLTIQEFLAALYVIYSFLTNNTEALECFHVPVSDQTTDLYDLLRGAVDKSLQDEYGHLDLFLRFLLGLSLQPNQKFFQSLLKSRRSIDIKNKITENIDRKSKEQTRKKMIAYIKDLRKENLSPERCINLFHCLLEMQDFTMQEEVKDYLTAPQNPRFLSPAHCSALAYILLMSEEALEELDLRQYTTTDEGRMRLLSAVRWCRKARLDCCELTPRAYQTVALSLQSLGSPLIELDLSYNCVEDCGVEQLAKGLLSPHCKLQALSLVGCHLTESSCLTMASVLQSHQSRLRELDLSDNDLRDLGVEHLASSLRSPNCKLQRLRLSMCCVSTKACAALAAALILNPSHLKELDLSYNYPKSTGVEQLSAMQQDPDCVLETLNVKHAGGYRLLSAPQKYFYKLHLDPMTAHKNLTVSERNRKVTGGPAQPSTGEPEPPERFDFWPQVLCREPLTGRCYWEVEWTGTAAIGVAYRGIISRKGRGDDGLLGNYPKSLALYCDEKSYSVHHNKKKTEIDFPPFECRRVGVFLDWPNGSVSFYRISSEEVLLLRTLYTNFNEPLYAVFTVHSSDTVISLCSIQA
ncbi:hypothetical protein ACEWY4_005716 [Coilia grayii]|uniref:NACHT, LRR and PYD domains-containing protein 12-like n=1 Tax=Coilia grayii TaxID=363190 RepID=A0ABD1KJ77_9TELE